MQVDCVTFAHCIVHHPTMSLDDAREDEAFRRILSDLKPYAKHLPKKSGKISLIFFQIVRSKVHFSCFTRSSDVRQKVTLWVKKLLSVSDQK